MTAPAAPKGAGPAGRRLWRALNDLYEFEAHELVLLREAVRLTDLLTDLHAVVEEEGVVVVDEKHGQRVHPAVVEARQSRLALARVLAVLRLPEGEEGEALRRPQRGAGVRQPYRLRSVAGGAR